MNEKSESEDEDEDEIGKRVRRTFQLTNFCIANIAAYRVNWKKVNGKSVPKIENDFWIRSNGAFFDMTVIEWCKLFADRDGKHHWSMTFQNKNEWLEKLLQAMQMDFESYEVELLKVKKYRDKYAAHLDNPIEMNYPFTEFMLESACFLYDEFRKCEQTKIHLGGTYDTAHNFYAIMFEEYNQEIEIRLSHS